MASITWAICPYLENKESVSLNLFVTIKERMCCNLGKNIWIKVKKWAKFDWIRKLWYMLLGKLWQVWSKIYFWYRQFLHPILIFWYFVISQDANFEFIPQLINRVFHLDIKFRFTRGKSNLLVIIKHTLKCSRILWLQLQISHSKDWSLKH